MKLALKHRLLAIAMIAAGPSLMASGQYGGHWVYWSNSYDYADLNEAFLGWDAWYIRDQRSEVEGDYYQETIPRDDAAWLYDYHYTEGVGWIRVW